MAGYYKYSMSNNARAAYSRGEMPLSKWTKAAIIEEISDNCDIGDEKLDLLKKLTVSELRNRFLKYSAWHHTSKFYNVTYFYEIDYDRVEEIEKADIEKIIPQRTRIKKSSQEIAAQNKITNPTKKEIEIPFLSIEEMIIDEKFPGLKKLENGTYVIQGDLTYNEPIIIRLDNTLYVSGDLRTENSIKIQKSIYAKGQIISEDINAEGDIEAGGEICANNIAGNSIKSEAGINAYGDIYAKSDIMGKYRIYSGKSITAGGSIESESSIRSRLGLIKAGGRISAGGGINAGSDIEAGKEIVGGYIKNGGDIYAGKQIEIQTHIESKGSINTNDSINAKEYIKANAYIKAGGSISTEGSIKCAELRSGEIISGKLKITAPPPTAQNKITEPTEDMTEDDISFLSV